MKLPFLDFFKKKTPTEYFLALLFRDERIHAVVFEQLNSRIQVIGTGAATLPLLVERASDEMLLEAADKAISFAEQSLPNGITTHKTVFGVKETWVEDTHITKEYLAKLKTISDQLDLQPIGFLVFPEAIAHLLQKEDGAPVSAILVETGKKQATITLIRAGRIVGTKEVPIEQDITTTVETALKQFDNVEIFPSRIILFETEDASIEKKFLTHHWSKSLPFLHVPQITTLPKDFDTRAILFGTATQMGLDAIDLIKQPLKKTEGFFEEEKENVTAPLPASEENNALSHPEQSEGSQLADIDSSPSVQNDNDGKPEEKEQSTENLEEVSGQDTSEYFGFVKNTDIAQKIENPHKTPLPSDSFEEVTKEIPEQEAEEELAGNAPGFSAAGPIFFEGAKKVARQIKGFLPKQISLDPLMGMVTGTTKKFPKNMNILLLLIPVGIVLLLGLFIWSFFGIRAKVTIFLTPKVISQDQAITFTTNGTTDSSKNIIAAQDISVTEEGKVSGNATGTKDVGDKAKGKVTIFNSDSNSHTLSSGTVITSNSGLKFTLDSSVTIASGSSDPTNLSAGTADVTVTASDIGTDYNLPSSTKFTISGTSVLAAKNASALSGGTKKTVTVVSQKDLDSLIDQLTGNLKDKAKSDLTTKVQSDTVILPDFTSTTATTKTFDKKVGDEAQGINLDGVISYDTIAYKKSDIESYTKSALSGQLSSGLTLAPDGITYDVKDETTKNGVTKVTLTIKGSLIPTLDTKSLSSQIAGKSFASARDILSGVPQFSDATFVLSPNFFFLPKSLPRISGNITLIISAHE